VIADTLTAITVYGMIAALFASAGYYLTR